MTIAVYTEYTPVSRQRHCDAAGVRDGVASSIRDSAKHHANLNNHNRTLEFEHTVRVEPPRRLG